jgi:hypothetical protein
MLAGRAAGENLAMSEFVTSQINVILEPGASSCRLWYAITTHCILLQALLGNMTQHLHSPPFSLHTNNNAVLPSQ